MKLSKRLETVASFAVQGSRIADIGTDHGYIPIFLVSNGIAESAIAMDIGKGPLERAQSHIESWGLSHKIETRLSDGLEKLKPGEADTVVIAGMGGELMVHILEEGKHMWDFVSRWICSPQSELDRFRHYLADNGFFIQHETMVLDEGKYYTVMVFRRGVMRYEKEAEYAFGKCLIEEGSQVFREYLKKEKNRVEQVLSSLEGKESEAVIRAKKSLLEELSLIKEAEYEMQ